MAKKSEDKKTEAIISDTNIVESPKTASKPTDKKQAAFKQAEAAKKELAKTAPNKAELAFTTIVQIGDKEFDVTDITAKAYKAYKSVHKRKTVTEFVVYVKPEENAAYYTVNGEGADEYKIDL